MMSFAQCCEMDSSYSALQPVSIALILGFSG